MLLLCFCLLIFYVVWNHLLKLCQFYNISYPNTLLTLPPPLSLYPSLPGGWSCCIGCRNLDCSGEERLLESAGHQHICCLSVYPHPGWRPGGGYRLPGLLCCDPGTEELSVHGETGDPQQGFNCTNSGIWYNTHAKKKYWFLSFHKSAYLNSHLRKMYILFVYKCFINR